MSWQVMPDVVPGRRLDADLNAEIWLAFALLAAQAQWGSSLRFNYGALARLRLAALLPLYQQAARSASETVIYAPYFYGLFASVAGEPAWNTFTSLLGNHARLKQTADFLPFTAEGSAEEAKRALSLLQAGVAVCWQAGFPQGKLPDGAQALARDTTARFGQADLLDESELNNEPAGLNPLGLLACCAPAVQSLQDQALLDQLWQGLSQAQPGRHDALGATLRLLALLQLSENIWFERAPWKALPALPED
jgi:endo-1,4-beta-D-glucanase Y